LRKDCKAISYRRRVFLSNIPEGLSSAAGMKNAGRTPRYIFSVWATIAVLCGVAALLGYTVFSQLSPDII
jgi:ZIP family zinc transporter